MSKQGSEETDPFGPFNLNDFRKWMDHQQDDRPAKPNMVGLAVESKIPFKKLLARLDVQDGEINEVAKDFRQNGGTITQVEGHTVLIEVDSGSFFIHRMYVKRPD